VWCQWYEEDDLHLCGELVRVESLQETLKRLASTHVNLREQLIRDCKAVYAISGGTVTECRQKRRGVPDKQECVELVADLLTEELERMVEAPRGEPTLTKWLANDMFDVLTQ
jgi:hypothetical protein